MNTGRTHFKKGHPAPKTAFQKGLIPWNKGKPHLVGEDNPAWKGGRPRCVVCNTQLASYKANFCMQHRDITGEKHPNWKGGITPLVLQIRHHFTYRQWISDIFTRDNFTCQGCWKRGGELEAHHSPKEFSVIFKENNIKCLDDAIDCDEFWNINNGITLCVSCHNKTKYGRPNKKV